MTKKILVIILGFLTGLAIGFYSIFQPNLNLTTSSKSKALPQVLVASKQVIGFLPYWLIDKAQKDYSPYITTLTYFGLTVDSDGTILKMTNPGEAEPGWHALDSGKVDPLLDAARQHNMTLSLLIFSGDPNVINELISSPVDNAHNLITDVLPIINQYGFTDLNLDIESIHEATPAARLNFTQFVQTIKNDLNNTQSGISLTVEITGNDLIKQNLIDPQAIVPFADYLVLMGYDYHYMGSYVTGAVAPLSGAGDTSEYDVKTALGKLEEIAPPRKIILGIPVYGYEWETINNVPRSAVLPGSGLTASNQRVEELLSQCASCSAQRDEITQEAYVIFKDTETGMYHQFFYPDKQSTKAKADLANNQDLGGLAVWALGYEGEDILEPLKGYK